MLILSVAGFGEIVNETLIGREFVTPDAGTVPTKSYVLLHAEHVNVPVNVPVEFAPGLKVIVKVAVPLEGIVICD
jgi:hypothetical protein